jgi:hypothetical protein
MKYLDYIPIERATVADKTQKAYGKSLPDDEIRSMGRAIPPEWTVNILALGKEPWRFKDLDDQLNMYRQQWQADRQKQIIAKMAGKIPDKSNDGNKNNNERNNHNNTGGRSGGGHQGNNGRGGRGGCGRGQGGRGGRDNSNIIHLKTIECFNCGQKDNYSTDCTVPRKNENENSKMVSKADFKNLFQFSMRDMLTKKQKETKKNMDVDDKSLDINVLEKLMEGKHNEIVSNDDDDSMSINSTNNLFHFGQNNLTDKSCLDNNYNNYYDEITNLFSKIVKLKHEPEEAQEKTSTIYCRHYCRNQK